MKIIWTVLLSLASTFEVLAQGYVSFANTPITRISTNGVLQAPAPAGSWYYALLVAPSTQNIIDTNSSHAFDAWTFVGLASNTPGVSGRLNGNTTTDGVGIPVPGFGTPATCDFVVVGWSANIGSNWNAIRAGFGGYDPYGNLLANWQIVDPTKPGGYSYYWFGISSVAQDILLAPLGGPYNSVFGFAGGGQIPGMDLRFPTPEPSALALLGVLTLAVSTFRGFKRESSGV